MDTTHPLLYPLLNANQQKTIFQQNDNQYLTHKELLNTAQQLARNLIADGFQKGDKVVLAIPSSKDFLIVFYALIYAGGVISIIDPHIGKDQYMAMFEQFEPKYLFLDYKLLFIQEHPLILRYLEWKKANIPFFKAFKNVQLIATGSWLPIFRKHQNLNKLLKKPTFFHLKPQFLATDEPFLITYTSGTLSQPKGVIHCIDALAKSLKHLETLVKSDKKVRIATNLPQYLLLGVACSIPVFYWHESLNGQEKWHFLKKNEITTLFGPPVEFMELIDFCNENKVKLPDSVQHILLGSAPITPIFLQKLIAICNENVKITCLYGMTENLLIAKIDGRIKANYSSTEGDVLGQLFDGVTVNFAENEEILVNSTQLFLKYWHLQDRNTPHPTGDLGFFNLKGELVLKG